MAKQRPENVKCIKSPFLETKSKTLCGKSAVIEFVFSGLDHAFCHAESTGRLQACSRCVDVALEGIEKARETTEEKKEGDPDA